jgi:pimeloyl-ACP methyl ester carboxylesterase
MAATTPPIGDADTLAPTPSSSDVSVVVADRPVIGAQATIEPADDPSIQPFQYHASDAELADLKRRILATKWPSEELVADATQGVQLRTMRSLADYWANDHDWRKVEARLNSYPNFVTNIDGLDIHFIHVKSKHPDALPVIITHGWPGSVSGPMIFSCSMTDPTAYGGKAEDAFDVVIPSMPGYGFSGKPTERGWDAPRIARAWTVLMKRLGYTRFVAQGGDWGALIADMLGVQAPPGLLGIHTNMAGAVPPEIDKAAQAGAPAPAGLGPDEKSAYERLVFFYTTGLGYAIEMHFRPQTLYALEDSPIGLAAWILDHDASSELLMARVFDGQSEGLTKDDILDNITLYWLTNTAISSARLYSENKLPFFAPKGVAIPVAVSAYPDEIYTAPRSWVEQAYPNLIHYNRLPKGTHFAAWEQPGYFTEELRTSFRSLR